MSRELGLDSSSSFLAPPPKPKPKPRPKKDKEPTVPRGLTRTSARNRGSKAPDYTAEGTIGTAEAGGASSMQNEEEEEEVEVSQYKGPTRRPGATKRAREEEEITNYTLTIH